MKSKTKMKAVWYWFIKRLDWLDDKVVSHRVYWFCEFICKHYPNEEQKK